MNKLVKLLMHVSLMTLLGIGFLLVGGCDNPADDDENDDSTEICADFTIVGDYGYATINNYVDSMLTANHSADTSMLEDISDGCDTLILAGDVDTFKVFYAEDADSVGYGIDSIGINDSIYIYPPDSAVAASDVETYTDTLGSWQNGTYGSCLNILTDSVLSRTAVNGGAEAHLLYSTLGDNTTNLFSLNSAAQADYLDSTTAILAAQTMFKATSLTSSDFSAVTSSDSLESIYTNASGTATQRLVIADGDVVAVMTVSGDYALIYVDGISAGHTGYLAFKSARQE
ncbi:MAG: hypothetical protein ACLFQK_08560 [Fibrobacterota bacterium]